MSERRWNPLTREWVLVSPHRTQRPWQGQVEELARDTQPHHDPSCYLCPGNPRAGGVLNPTYDSTFVFDNDFAALLPTATEKPSAEEDIFVAEPETGRCRVVCFSPRHDLTLARMPVSAIEDVVRCWQRESAELSASPDVGYVQVFENRGAMMGCSNPHPHGQIWASAHVPNEPAREEAALHAYREAHGGACLLCRTVALELEKGERVVCANDGYVAIVPYWAVWPFETLVLPRQHVSGLSAVTNQTALAAIIKELTIRYDNLFKISFPYSMGIHQAPTKSALTDAWHMHMHFYPPLLRSATVRKFMVGYEMLGGPQRDITPEAAAQRLREVPSTHYATA
jgi:UDPglucose--hexose-1-phosphate uridylyltransferase